MNQTRSEWLKLCNPTLIGLISSKEIRRLLMSAISRESPIALRVQLVKSFRSVKIRDSLNGFAKKIEQFGIHRVLHATDLCEDNAWALLLAQFEYDRVLIQKYIQLRMVFKTPIKPGWCNRGTA